MKLLARLVGLFLVFFARLVTGAQARWQDCKPELRQRLYFANHSSHLDFLLLWALLPPHLRSRTRPVAGADYWLASPVRRFLIRRVFRGVLVERAVPEPANPDAPRPDRLIPIVAAIRNGDSLIFFPEGTRNLGEELQPFKSGLYHIAAQCPQIELMPVRIENLNRVMPKGEMIPIPLICTLTFGAPIALQAGEGKDDFLARARQAIIDLAPKLV